MLQINKISHSYGNTKALDDISFNVEKGMIFGLIGADGAGKTTLIRIITTLIIPDKGTAIINQFNSVKDYKEIRKIVGYMPGRFSLYQDLSVEENLSFFASVFNTTIKENYDIIKPIYSQIELYKNRRASDLSGGMKQKLALCCSLIHNPKLLILDEPTTGVDPVSRKEFWDILKILSKHGITILVSTPYMDEAYLCDKIALINEGKILQTDTPQNIVKANTDQIILLKANNMYKLLTDSKLIPSYKSSYIFGEHIHLTLTEKLDETTCDKINAYFTKLGNNNIKSSIIKPNIEDCFIKYA